ncbi:MAG: hypothetical protein AABW81_01760 [Nanoarchaeota archaeon]
MVLRSPIERPTDQYKELIDYSKIIGIYPDLIGIASKIPQKTDTTVKLGLVKFFILNCPEVKKFINSKKPTSKDYLTGFKSYLEYNASNYREDNPEKNWHTAQKDLAEKLLYCSIHCLFLPETQF